MLLTPEEPSEACLSFLQKRCTVIVKAMFEVCCLNVYIVVFIALT